MIYSVESLHDIQAAMKTVLPRDTKYSKHLRNTNTAWEHSNFFLKLNCKSQVGISKCLELITDVSNYSSICPVVSKLFEHRLLNKFHKYQ